ncbi:MAG: hypothetical protein GY870_15400 [archaeon]|nr:hypothetical protein [archaeon]
MKEQGLKLLLKGDFTSASMLLKYIILGLGTQLSLLFVAWLFFPPELNYFWMTMDISTLGSTEKNVTGWIFFTLSISGGSFIILPIVEFIYKKMVVVNKWITYFNTLLMSLGLIGMFLVGLFPENVNYEVHLLTAIFAFCGLGFGFLFNFFIFIIDQIPKLGGKKLYDFKKVIIPFVILFLVAIGLAVTQVPSIIETGTENRGAGFVNFSFWEWTLFISLLVCICWVTLVLAKNDEKMTKK